MNFWWTTLIASIVGVTHALPCSDLGWSTLEILPTGNYDLMHLVQYPNPLVNNPLWDIVKAKDCYVRFQVPLEENGNVAEITKTEFIATPDQVLHTMNNYFNDQKKNIMLWLPMTSKAFQYGNVMRLVGNNEQVDGQMGLDIDKSYFPVGRENLRELDPTKEIAAGKKDEMWIKRRVPVL
ncbi:hypothetical protein VE00_08680 [Pseudogymnoascus sp. WSF 3629]|nr:hypothetical protein VE00_08680 [Pseudogymnoascus sp. WSF 3629]